MPLEHGNDAGDGDRDVRRAQQGAPGSLSPNSAGTAILPEIRMTQARRLGGRATSFGAAIVLLRAARMAGTRVAASATTIARLTTSAVALSEIGGAPAMPISAAQPAAPGDHAGHGRGGRQVSAAPPVPESALLVGICPWLRLVEAGSLLESADSRVLLP